MRLFASLHLGRAPVHSTKSTLILPILLITIGCGWLLTSTGLAPGVDWIWTLSVAVAGVMTLILGGIDKLTIIIGPFFITASLLSIIRQADWIRVDIEIPLLVIVAGLLMLLAHWKAIPTPPWFIPGTPGQKEY